MSTTPKKHKVLLTLDAELYAILKATAEREGIPVATFAASRLRRQFESNDTPSIVPLPPRAGQPHVSVTKQLKRDVSPNVKKGAK